VDSDIDRPYPVQRIPGVDAEIEQHLLDLDLVREHAWHFVHLHLKLQRRRHRRSNEIVCICNECWKRDRTAVASAAPGEGKKLLDQVPRPQPGRLCLIEVTFQLHVPVTSGCSAASTR
jgi:hypothetical protein